MDLHHPAVDCPGQWVRAGGEGGKGWRCTRCGAVYSGDDATARDAIWREYEMELLFFRLGAQGRLLLGVERAERPTRRGESG
jgi:hypothetical protein